MGKCQKRIVDRPKMYDRYNLITNEGEKVVISLIHTYFED